MENQIQQAYKELWNSSAEEKRQAICRFMRFFCDLYEQKKITGCTLSFNLVNLASYIKPLWQYDKEHKHEQMLDKIVGKAGRLELPDKLIEKRGLKREQMMGELMKDIQEYLKD